jgi:hypothetical protein
MLAPNEFGTHQGQLLNCGSAWETCNLIWKLEKDTKLKVIIFLRRCWSARNKDNDGGSMLMKFIILSITSKWSLKN